jgi:ATP-dependent Zn protease
MFVGVGASRVRDMFAQATKHAPVLYLLMRLMLLEDIEGQVLVVGMMKESKL